MTDTNPFYTHFVSLFANLYAKKIKAKFFENLCVLSRVSVLYGHDFLPVLMICVLLMNYK